MIDIPYLKLTFYLKNNYLYNVTLQQNEKFMDYINNILITDEYKYDSYDIYSLHISNERKYIIRRIAYFDVRKYKDSLVLYLEPNKLYTELPEEIEPATISLNDIYGLLDSFASLILKIYNDEYKLEYNLVDDQLICTMIQNNNYILF